MAVHAGHDLYLLIWNHLRDGGHDIVGVSPLEKENSGEKMDFARRDFYHDFRFAYDPLLLGRSQYGIA